MGVRYLRAQDLREGEITASNPIYITQRYFATLGRSHIKPGNLLFSIMASIGNAAIVPLGFPPATANRAVGILVPKHEGSLLTSFLFHLFATNLGGELYTRIKKGGLQQRTNLADVETLEFPLPPEAVQRKLITAMDAAQAERQAKLAEADALLAGLDDFLLTTLLLTHPPKDNRKTFAARRADVSTRFDPHFHLPSLAQNTRMLTASSSEPLGSLVSFSNEVWRPTNHVKATFRYIEIRNVNPKSGEARAEEIPVSEAPSRARMVVRTGDIVVSLTRPHHGSIAQITPALDGSIASTGFSVLRDVSERLNRNYLWCVLRSKMCLLQMLQRARFCSQLDFIGDSR